MSFHTDIVAISLRDYPHSPALLADLCREGYELFNPDGHVFFRKHNRLASTPVTASPPAAPQPAPAQTAPAAAAPEPDDEQDYAEEYPEPDDEPAAKPEPAPATVGDQGGSVYLGDVPLHGDGIDYDVLASRVYAELLKRQRRKPIPGLH